jgi:hypothetical protein
MAIGCGTSSPSSSSSTGTPNAYTAVYKAMTWGSTVTVSFPSSCEMTVTTTGKPDYTPSAYYLAPAGMGQTVVAHTSVSNTALAVISYASVIEPSLEGSSATINICPTQASSTTATGLGAIGYLISGTAMFNPFEMDASTAAVGDNASYTFTDGSGNMQTAYFLDAHGDPICVDTSKGASRLVGIALDGFPIYGGRDINGNVINVSQLDACNGITSATPDFPSGAYHYVLPIGVTSKYASMNCYSGTVSSGTMAKARKLACNMKTMFAMIEKKQKGKESMAAMEMGNGEMRMGSM